jgi:hypothetical protein
VVGERGKTFTRSQIPCLSSSLIIIIIIIIIMVIIAIIIIAAVHGIIDIYYATFNLAAKRPAGNQTTYTITNV